MADLAVTAFGADRPGILATLAEVLRDHTSNVAQATMTTLAGHVAVVLEVTTDDDPEHLRAALADATATLGVTVSVAPAVAHGGAPPATHLLSVYGSDQTGLLAEVTRAVADAGATIVALDSQLLEDETPPTWVMSVEVVASESSTSLAERITTACEHLGVDHQLRAIDADD